MPDCKQAIYAAPGGRQLRQSTLAGTHAGNGCMWSHGARVITASRSAQTDESGDIAPAAPVGARANQWLRSDHVLAWRRTGRRPRHHQTLMPDAAPAQQGLHAGPFVTWRT
jgi:hypothetical protein